MLVNIHNGMNDMNSILTTNNNFEIKLNNIKESSDNKMEKQNMNINNTTIDDFDISEETSSIIVYEFISTFTIMKVHKSKEHIYDKDISNVFSDNVSLTLISALSQYLNNLNFNSDNNNSLYKDIYKKYSQVDYAFIDQVDKNILLKNLNEACMKLHWILYAKPNVNLSENDAKQFLYENIKILYTSLFNKPFYIEQTNEVSIEYYLNLGMQFYTL